MKVEGKKLMGNIAALRGISKYLVTAADIKQTLAIIDSCVLCRGNDDQRFIPYISSKKGNIVDQTATNMLCVYSMCTCVCNKKYTSIVIIFFVWNPCAGTSCVAFLDTKHSTVHCSDCELLVLLESSHQVPRCSRCKYYRHNLRALVNRSEREREEDVTSPSSHAPFCYLNSPQKAKRYQQEHKLRRSCEHRIGRMRQRLAVAVEERGFTEDTTLSNDLSQIMGQNDEIMRHTHPSGSFAHIFWDSQARAASLKDPRQMQWDPMMVRWCLYLRHLSSSAYEDVRESGAIRLPSQRTLCDYTYTIPKLLLGSLER